MYMRAQNPIVECTVEGEDLPFVLDTGASDTTLAARYFRELHSESTSWKKRTQKIRGAGGVVIRKGYVQPELKLAVDNRTVFLKNVWIYDASTGTSFGEWYGGALGQDVAANFESVSLDFENMTFNFGEPILPSGLLKHAGSEQDPTEIFQSIRDIYKTLPH